MKRTRAALRQASKSDLARTNKALYGERSWLLAASARRWKRKLRHAVGVALVVGAAAGYFAARLLGRVLESLPVRVRRHTASPKGCDMASHASR